MLNTFPQNPPNYTITSSLGSYLVLDRSRKIFDLTGGQTSHCTIGWGNQDVISAISKQLHKCAHIDYKAFIDHNRNILSDLLLSENLNNFKNVYFAGNSGGEACEAAMKLSFQTHHLNGESRSKFLSRKESYHGSSTEAMSLGDRPNLEMYRPLFPDNKIYVPEHNYYRCSILGESEDQYLNRSLCEIEKIILSNNPETICAFIGETMTGGLSGYVPPSGAYWKRLKQILDRHGIHLIIDEVITGTGTSGTYHCIERDNVEPDFLFIGKTLTSGYVPLNAVLLGKKVNDILSSTTRVQHSTTHQGHSLGVAAAIAVQSICKSKDLLSKVDEHGQEMRKRFLKNLSQSTFFKNCRGRGYRFAVEYQCDNMDEFGRILTKKLFDDNDLLIDAKWHRITLSPMLTEDPALLNEKVDLICEKFLEIEKKWGEHIHPNINKTISDPQARSF
jgi:adenosylmethionine-8-amino-7-oxononanoate aminotransferase